MNLENKFEKASEEALEMLQNAEDKSQAIVDVIEKLAVAKYSDLINELKEQSLKAESDSQYAKSLGLRVLSKEEKAFYEKLKDVKQAITADQIDIIPSSIIDRTLDNVKKNSKVLSLVNFTPADVKKWIVAEKSGTFAWGTLTGKITSELSATIQSLNIELSKLHVLLIIPKAIRELSLPFVDKYFTAILNETLNDGMEYGYLQGTGKDEPIGIYKLISSVNEDGTHKDKTVNSTITSFSPKALAPVKKGLSKGGLRTIDKIALICNPNDQADYVDPAIMDREGRIISSYKNIEVMPCANNPEGKAAFVLPGKYVMGFSGLKVKEYDQTLALDDADAIIAKAYANGRAVDDDIAYVFDVTKLEEYIPTVITKEVVEGA